MAKNRENHYRRLTSGSDTKFKGVVHVRESYYIYSTVLPLREAYAWTVEKVNELPEYQKAYVQTWDETKL